MMGPLSGKEKREYLKLMAQQQREDLKLAREEERKQELHELKLAQNASMANAKAKEVGGTPVVPRPRRSFEPVVGTRSPLPGAHLPPNTMAIPTNPEAGPGDKVPALLTPGEAVIPAPAAQDPRNKPIIQEMVNQGRAANRSPLSGINQNINDFKRQRIDQIIERGYQDGTTKVDPEKLRKAVEKAKTAPLGSGMAEEARKKLLGRKSQLEEQERKIMGYQDGTVSVSSSSPFKSEEEFQAFLKSIEGKDPSSLSAKEKEIIMEATSGVDRLAAKDVPMTAPPLDPRLTGTEGIPKNYVRNKREQEMANQVANTLVPSQVDQVPALPNQSVGLTPEQKIEMDTLKRFVENPGTNATERGKAMNRLRELERLQGNLAMPALQSNYQGTSVPAGQSAPEGAVVTTKPPVVGVQTVPLPEKATPLEREKVTAVETEVKPFYENPEEGADKVTQVLNSPEAQAKLSAAASQGPAPTGNAETDNKNNTSFLAGILQSIYDPTGMFSKDELLRFSLLAAGGMLLGGSPAGSVRYAALDTLRQRDARVAAQSQALAKASENFKTELSNMDKEFRTALSTATPQARALAMQQAYKSQDPKARMADLKQAILTLRNNPAKDETAENSANKVTGQVLGRVPGINQDVMIGTRNSKPVYLDLNGNWVDADPKKLPRSIDDIEKERKNVIDSSKNRIKSELHKAFGRDKNYRADLEADKYAEALALLHKDFEGSISPTDFAKVSEMAVRSAISAAEATGTELTEEGLRKAFYGNAVMTTRFGTQSKELYTVPTDKKNETKPLSGAAVVTLGNAVEQTAKMANVNKDEAIQLLEKGWFSLPKETRDKWNAQAKGTKDFNGFTFWLYNNAPGPDKQ